MPIRSTKQTTTFEFDEKEVKAALIDRVLRNTDNEFLTGYVHEVSVLVDPDDNGFSVLLSFTELK